MKQPTASPRRVLIVVSAAVFMASLDLFIVNIAFPDIQADLGGTDSELSWVLNAYAIVIAALLVPLGRIADNVGRKRAFVAGLVVFAQASALAAAAPSVGFLVGARVLQAVGAAMLIPTSLALLLSAAPLEKRTAYVGAWAAAGGVAAAAGPPIGGLLVQLSWRWVFIVNVPVAAIAIYAAVRTLREERD
jgi:MFS family permease